MRQYAFRQAMLSDLLKTHCACCSPEVKQASRRLLKRQPQYEQKAAAYIQATAITSGGGHRRKDLIKVHSVPGLPLTCNPAGRL